MLPKTSTFKSLSYCKTPLNIPRFGRRYFSYSWHVGTSVRVAQSTFAFDCWFQSLIFSLIRVWIRLFLLPSPQIKCNCRAGKALEHTEVHLWNLIIKSPRWQFVSWFCNRSKKLCSDHKPSFYHKMKYHIVFAYLDANKQNRTKHLSIQGKISNSCKNSSRNQNNFSSCQQARRVQQYLQQMPSSACLSRILSLFPILDTPLPQMLLSFILAPGYKHFFREESTKLYSRALFVFS